MDLPPIVYMNTHRVLLFVLSTAALMLCTTAAQAQISVSLPDMEGEHGETISVAISVSEITGQNVTSYGGDITFDPALVDIVGFDASGVIASQFSNVSNEIEAGTFRIGGFTSNGQPATGSGAFVNLQVELLSPGTSTLVFDNFRFNDGTPSVDTTNGSVTVVVTPVVSTNAGLTVDEGGAATITTAVLQATDADNPADELTYTIDSAPSAGQLERDGTPLAAGENFTQADIDADLVRYVHSGSETIADSFSFTLLDPGGLGPSGSFDITITPVNDPPSFTSDPVMSIQSDQTYSYTATTEDVDGGSVSLSMTTGPGWLDLTDIGDGTAELTGVPALGDVGDHSLVLEANDGSGGVTEQSFVVSVTAGPDADGIPDAIEDGAPNGGDGNSDGIADSDQAHVASLPNPTTGAYITLESPDGTTLVDVQVTSDLPEETLPRDADFPVGVLYFELEGVTTGGDAVVNVLLAEPVAVNSYWKYGPVPGDASESWYDFRFDSSVGAELIAGEATGEVSEIRLHLTDGATGDHDLSENGRIVDPGAAVDIANAAPTAADDNVGTSAGEAVVLDVLANDTDPDGDALTIEAVTQPASGSVEVTSGGPNVTYTPDESFDGSDSFTYTVSDGLGGSDEATVVVSVNGAPVAQVDSVDVEEDENIEIAVLANDSDPNGDALSVLGVSNTERFEVLEPSGANASIRFNTQPDSSGIYETWYTIGDGNGLTDSSRVVVTVSAVNDAPGFADEDIFLSPEPGAEITLGFTEGQNPVEPNATFEVDWRDATDPEGDEVTYGWLLSTTATLDEPLLQFDTGTSSMLETTVGSLLDEVRAAGFEYGTTANLYHGVIAYDGTDSLVVDAVALNLVVGTVTSAESDDLPASFELHPSYPNPFNPATKIEYSVPEAVEVTLKVYNALGREVATLVDGHVPAGRYTVTFDGSGLASGTYLYRLTAGSYTSVRQTVLMK